MISQGFFVSWLFCLIGWFKPIKLVAWKICGEKLKSFYFLPRCFPVINRIGSCRPISEKKLPRKKSSWLFSLSGEMPLMINTNSKILPNLSCYSPSALTFSVPAFYLFSFMILVGGRFPLSKNTDIFYVMVGKGMTGECPQEIAHNKLPLEDCPH